MVRPVSTQHSVTLGYRQRPRNPRLRNYIHRGIDYGCRAGTPVAATTAGTVIYAGDARPRGGGYGPAFGIHVVIKTGNTWHLYGHLSAEHVKVGQMVAAGQRIGLSGATGNVTGAHLHYAEFTEGPAAYMSDRAPRFIDAGAPAGIDARTVFDLSFWAQAHAPWFGTSWASRADGIVDELQGDEIGTEASIHVFTEVYTAEQVATIRKALPGFERAREPRGGPAGQEIFHDAERWRTEREAVAYASGIQGRYAFVDHLERISTGDHVAIVSCHGPIRSNSDKRQFGRFIARLVDDVDGPIVIPGDFNRVSKSPRTEIEELGYRTMRAQAAIANEGAYEFPSKRWNLSDIYTIPSEARITGGEVDLTPARLSDHRRLEARIVLP